MIDIQNKEYCPTVEEIGQYINNSLFARFCEDVQMKYHCAIKVEFSSCTWELGWNVKFRISGKNLCTVYPREGYFTVLVVIGQKEQEAVEVVLQEATTELRDIYEQTKTGNGQKWLMIDLEDDGEMYSDVFRLIDIRRKTKSRLREE